jgi:hypothetical protein
VINIAGLKENDSANARLDSIFRRLGVNRDAFTFSNSEAVTLAFGPEALKATTGKSGMDAHHGYVLDGIHGERVIATYHPQFLIEGNAQYTPAVEMAISKALLVDQHSYSEDILDLRLNPSLAELTEIVRLNPGPLMVDIETPHGNDDEEPANDPSFIIQRVGVSWAPGKALSVPWAPPYSDFLRTSFSLCQELHFWNKYFDWPRLKADGVKSEARIVDAQEAWHFLQSDMRRGLGFVAPFFVNTSPWKHLSSDKPEFYNAKDAAVQSLIYQRVRRSLAQRGGLAVFDRHCIEAGSLLSRMGFIMVDPQRQKTFMADVAADLKRDDDALQALIPTACLPVKTFKKKAQVTLRFNAGSPKQVNDLCKFLGIKLDKGTGAKFLKAKKNKILNKILEVRASSKLLSTYEYRLDEKNQVRTTYTFKPSTLRKASQDPNLQNIPSRSALASKFKAMFIARPGYTLIEADSSAIEAVIVGYCAESPEYIRLAKAGVHGWLCAQFSGHAISLSLPDAELKSECAAWKAKDKDLYDKMKRVIHLSNYAGTGYRMAMEYPDDFPSKKAADQLQEYYFSTLPGRAVKRWHASTIARATKECFLDNHFGYRHYFYAMGAQMKVSPRTGNPYNAEGPDVKRAIAYVPQSDASAIQTEILLSLPEWFKPALRLVIHDSIVAEVPTNQLDKYASILQYSMIQSWPQLGGLSIGCDVRYGPSLGELKTWHPKDAVKLGERLTS